MTKAGNEMLRRLLVQAAHYQLGPHGPESDLRRWGSWSVPLVSTDPVRSLPAIGPPQDVRSPSSWASPMRIPSGPRM
jgi:hypothetical protein